VSSVPVANKNGDAIDPAVKEKILKEYLENPGARTRLAQSMAAPIRRNIDYQSTARKVFSVDQMGPKHSCPSCGMGWDDDAHVHDDEECAVYRVHES